MGVRGCDSKCLFSGSRGEVCCLEPLLLHQFNMHPLHGVVLVAMATLSKVKKLILSPLGCGNVTVSVMLYKYHCFG
jgi:hypothetical protein